LGLDERHAGVLDLYDEIPWAGDRVGYCFDPEDFRPPELSYHGCSQLLFLSERNASLDCVDARLLEDAGHDGATFLAAVNSRASWISPGT